MLTFVLHMCKATLGPGMGGLAALCHGADTEFSLTFEAQAAAKCLHCHHHMDLRCLNLVGDGDERWE